MGASRHAAVLVVEDESIVAHDLQQTLARLGYDAFATASSGDEAMARASEKRPDVAVVDIRIKGRTDGIKTAQLLQERFSVAVVYLTAHVDDATLDRAKRTRPYGYLLKPVKPAELKSAIEIALFRHEADAPARPGSTPPQGITAPSPPAKPARAPGAKAVRHQVERILGSHDFDASPRSKDFLRFIVEEALAGRGAAVTQSAIATRVFARRDDFDATVDPIVRIQAGRLRRSLERYYLLSGKQDPVRIELPRGTYIPTFSTAAGVEPTGPSERLPEPAAQPITVDDWPSLVIRPFEPAEPGPEHTQAAGRVTEELVLELGRYRGLRTLLQRELDQQEPSRRERVRFSLGGRLRAEDGDLKVSAQLVDRATGEQVWGDEYHNTPRSGRWSGSLDDIARVIAARVGAEEGVIVQLLAAERRKRRPAGITPFGAMLLSHEFFLTRDPEKLAPSLEALQEAVKSDPDSAVLWTRLGCICYANHAFEVTKGPPPIEQAISYAQTGVRLDPASRRGRCILAAALLVKGELEGARDELEQALRLSPDSLVYLEIIGSLLSLLGDERGPAIVRTARERNPHALTNALMGLWFEHLRRGETERAYQCAREYREPTFFWRGVMRASCLGLLGRLRDAEVEVADVLERKPDFRERGRIVIGYQIKSPEVMGLVVDGLARAGLKLN